MPCFRLRVPSPNPNPQKQMIADTPETINLFRLLSMKAGLRLECLGLRHSRGSVASLVRAEIGSKTKDKVALLDELKEYIARVAKPE